MAAVSKRAKDLLKIAAVATSCTAVGFAIGHYVVQPKEHRVNTSIRLGEKQVRDTIYIDDIEEKASLCRCWKSTTFPYCDGSHKEHNQCTGDNTGPVVIRRHKDQ